HDRSSALQRFRQARENIPPLIVRTQADVDQPARARATKADPWFTPEADRGTVELIRGAVHDRRAVVPSPRRAVSSERRLADAGFADERDDGRCAAQSDVDRALQSGAFALSADQQ